MQEILKQKSPEIYSIPDHYIFYIPGKLEFRTRFSKIEIWRQLKEVIKYEEVLKNVGFNLEGSFNQAKFYLNDNTRELWYGNELDVKTVLENSNFHPSRRTELRNFITTEVFKSLTSQDFHQSLFFRIVVPDKIDQGKSYFNNKQRKDIIQEFKKMKEYIISYTSSFSNDKREQGKNKFQAKCIVLKKSIQAFTDIISAAEKGAITDFELLMLTRLLVYQLNKKS